MKSSGKYTFSNNLQKILTGFCICQNIFRKKIRKFLDLSSIINLFTNLYFNVDLCIDKWLNFFDNSFFICRVFLRLKEITKISPCKIQLRTFFFETDTAPCTKIFVRAEMLCGFGAQNSKPGSKLSNFQNNSKLSVIWLQESNAV